ncbi:MAG: ADP-ribose pyrophosphatase, partial [Actinomycetota bacterium]|nr:ADP-ribose pyrophosphatase [Actinomycetota bacterium]
MERLSTRIVYRNAWMTVREDAVRRADGAEGIYGVVEKPDFALVLPRDAGGFWMVEQ